MEIFESTWKISGIFFETNETLWEFLNKFDAALKLHEAKKFQYTQKKRNFSWNF